MRTHILFEAQGKALQKPACSRPTFSRKFGNRHRDTPDAYHMPYFLKRREKRIKNLPCGRPTFWRKFGNRHRDTPDAYHIPYNRELSVLRHKAARKYDHLRGYHAVGGSVKYSARRDGAFPRDATNAASAQQATFERARNIFNSS